MTRRDPPRIDPATAGLTRRRLLIGAAIAAPALILGYSGILPIKKYKKKLMMSGEALSLRARNLIGREALAREYSPADISPNFRTNGSTSPDSAQWQTHAETGFVNWRFHIDGLVNTPLSFSLSELRALPARTQITRHDCVEGWSAIGQWTGVPLSVLLNMVGLRPNARYLVMMCADNIRGWQYYESIDLIDGFHPQTILAYDMNGAPLPTGHGAPLRLRVERQLGYKHAKFLERIEVVDDLSAIGIGGGGFWEDVSGYAWYAGI